MKKKVIIIDYKLGNLFSVNEACKKVGIPATISSDKAAIEEADALILPGVGSFREAMKNMHNLDIAQPVKNFVLAGKPIFGICLGQQLLFTESEEFGSSKGLDLIPGIIRKFSEGDNGKKLKVPQIGWNKIYRHSQAKDWLQTPLSEVPENSYMYFVHSFYAVPSDATDILSMTEYENIIYTSSIVNNNIFATQFHPEKSGELGLSIYAQWARRENLINI
jgi:glutamine amidotransferase